jgi:DNA-binding beta-propeller fold protein YncE
MKSPLGGGAAATLASGQNGPVGIAVDSTDVYFTVANDGTVMKVGLAGGPPYLTLAVGLSYPFGITADATSVYWNDLANGTVTKLAKP